MPPPDERADPGLVRFLRKQRARGMLCGGSRLHVEPGERAPCQVDRPGSELTCRRVELPEQRAVLLLGRRVRCHGEHGRVLHLPGPGVADRPPVGGRRGQPRLSEVVAVGEAGQDECGVDGREDIGHLGGLGVRGDHLGHGLRLHGVPELQDGEPGAPVPREPFELGTRSSRNAQQAQSFTSRASSDASSPPASRSERRTVPPPALDRSWCRATLCGTSRSSPPPPRGAPRRAGRRR